MLDKVACLSDDSSAIFDDPAAAKRKQINLSNLAKCEIFNFWEKLKRASNRVILHDSASEICVQASNIEEIYVDDIFLFVQK